MISKVQTNFQTSYNTSFQAKVPNKKLVITCFNNSKNFVADKVNFDMIKNSRSKFSIRDMFFEMFPNLDPEYRALQRSEKLK